MEGPSLKVLFIFLRVSSTKLTSGVSAPALTKNGTTINVAMLDSIEEATNQSEDASNLSTVVTIMIIISYICYTVLSGLSALSIFLWSVLVLCVESMS